MTATNRVRRAARVAAAIAVLSAVTLTTTSPSGGEVVPTPQAAAITVTPDTGLVDGQTVTVAGTGFAPDSVMFVLQCRVGATTNYSCGWVGYATVQSDGSGAFTTSLQLNRLLYTFSGAPVFDCTPAGSCAVTVLTSAGSLAEAPIAFDPTVPPLAPFLTVSPATGILPGQSVDVVGSGFVPDSPVAVRQCARADLGVGCSTGIVATPATDGNFAASVPVVRSISTLFDGVVDCAVPGHCVISARPTRPGSPSDVEVPIGVVDDGSPLVQQLVVTPSTGLVDGQVVTFETFDEPPPMDSRYRGYGADYPGQCLAGSLSRDDCAFSRHSQRVRTTKTGAIWTLAVQRILDTPNGPIDCGVEACVVSVGGGNFVFFSAPITFAVDVVAPNFTG